MGKKILLADDSITIQKVIELTFSDEDFDVVTVGNGRLALEKAQEVRPDIVLCDIIMPEKDGYEVCESIKKNPALQHVPVLLLTGAFEPFDQDRAARVGSDGFLAKPFEPETLIAKVKELLSRAASRPPSSQPPRSAPAPGGAIPFVPPAAREGETPTRASMPPLTVVPPRPPEPIPFPRVAAPPPAAERPAPAVSFIPEEPFEDLDAASFVADDEPAPPPARNEQAPYRSAAEELLPMTPEESESLSVPDASATVMFKAEAAPWQAPDPRPAPSAPPPPAPAPAPVFESPAPDATGESAVFEEVIEEDVEFGGVYPPPPAEPPAPAPPPPPAVVYEPRPSPPAPPAPTPASSKPPSRPPAPSAPLPRTPPPVVRPERPVDGPLPTVAVAPPWLATPEEAEAELIPEPEVEAPAPPVATPPPAPAPPAAEARMAPPPAPAWAPPAPAAPVRAAPAAPPPAKVSAESFADLAGEAPAAGEPANAPSEAAEVAVPVEMVEKIAQRVVAQISERVVREIAWEVIPDLAEALIRAEIERLKAELQRI